MLAFSICAYKHNTSTHTRGENYRLSEFYSINYPTDSSLSWQNHLSMYELSDIGFSSLRGNTTRNMTYNAKLSFH